MSLSVLVGMAMNGDPEKLCLIVDGERAGELEEGDESGMAEERVQRTYNGYTVIMEAFFVQTYDQLRLFYNKLRHLCNLSHLHHFCHVRQVTLLFMSIYINSRVLGSRDSQADGLHMQNQEDK